MHKQNCVSLDINRLHAWFLVKMELIRGSLIDLPRAKLAICALVAEVGVQLKGEDTLAWNHLPGRTWRQLEAYEWEKQHAA